MSAVKIVLQVLLVLTSILLTLLILMHKGKGGGLSDMFGGGLTKNAGSSGVAEKNLNRWTVIIALIWVAVIVALNLMTKFSLI
ncbi:preprotein translocase subunit SecG [Gardnerella sp. DNF00354]|uniref:Protein-export membrane protein SecG n=9 Tax=Gardnerella TaxID=2701 RepID=A0A133NQA7_GARVA|nr:MULTISPECIES: preprotein translocase subunit SecG [Gardnerella]EPI48386.1 preprotein translocase, SecG subunit [Gardnerella vaginalis JCP8151A]MDK6472083.1 preprotein translocase subunit SecG [Bifidobacterium sp. UMB9259]MDK7189498.1 preprotein translocase subunit SecG [Bifidobacterium sp. UMB1230]MDK7192048.1 preprotein translocase subunit SecG [Bifidobacterium sp. UMB1197]MDK7785247.1 preprotein translocase subunit SecG [Bifidobacterium sp. UMB6791B]MDK8248572.1 preprotein translocase su